jgi:exopolysaccharide biosynthesis polyprenyl glycosylphosphotransferase
MSHSKQRKRLRLLGYLFADAVAALLVWALFYLFRKLVIEPQSLGMAIPVEFDKNFYLGLLLSVPFWLTIHAGSGFYQEIDRRSRLHVLLRTLGSVLFGVLILFFLIFLDDIVSDYRQYYRSLLMFFGAMLFFTLLPRLLLTTWHQHQVKKGKLQTRVLIVGGDEKAKKLFLQLKQSVPISGYRFVGFIAEGKAPFPLEAHLPRLGDLSQSRALLNEYQIEEVILAEESSAHFRLQHLITLFSEKEIQIKLTPDLFNIVSGTVRFSSLFDTPLMEVQAIRMPVWQQGAKRVMDLGVSLLALLILSPIFLIIALAIRSDSPGTVFYSHERVGRYGRPFRILKFRSMVANAERKGPALSSDNDTRITRVGKLLRKYRLDELPQFINVIKGEMSLVGPRPERQYFIHLIEKEAPHYRLLHRVKPGITSWGQVKFGYAENVEEMLERLKYDLLYIENMSLMLDIKILFFTIRTVWRAEGK